MSDDLSIADLCGLRQLDGRGEFILDLEGQDSDSATVVVLRLDGEMYWFQEDPQDGYRSGLGVVRKCASDEIPPGAFVEFAPRLVSLAVRTKPDGQADDARWLQVDEVLVGTDEATGAVLFEIGTANTDDYYPYWLHEWTPPTDTAAVSVGCPATGG